MATLQAYLSATMTNQLLSRDQIAALPVEQIDTAYERAKADLDTLLKWIETDNSKKGALQEQLQAARLQYVLLRARAYPHFSKILVAA